MTPATKATDGSAKNEATNLPRSETKVCGALRTHGSRWGTISPRLPQQQAWDILRAGVNQKEHRQADPSRPCATTSPRATTEATEMAQTALQDRKPEVRVAAANRDRTDGFKGGHSRIEEGALR